MLLELLLWLLGACAKTPRQFSLLFHRTEGRFVLHAIHNSLAAWIGFRGDRRWPVPKSAVDFQPIFKTDRAAGFVNNPTKHASEFNSVVGFLFSAIWLMQYWIDPATSPVPFRLGPSPKASRGCRSSANVGGVCSRPCGILLQLASPSPRDAPTAD